MTNPDRNARPEVSRPLGRMIGAAIIGELATTAFFGFAMIPTSNALINMAIGFGVGAVVTGPAAMLAAAVYNGRSR